MRIAEWKLKGRIPATLVAALCQTLKVDPRFSGQPSRFYISAIHVVEYVYKSWLALQERLRSQLTWNIRWLGLLNSDADLVEISGCSLAAIRAKAADILAQIASQEQAESKGSLFNRLLTKHRNPQNLLDRCAINHLLKNRCQVNLAEENVEKLAKHRRKTEIRVERLQKRIETGRLPQGRDLTGEKWLETLESATTTVPTDESEASKWQSNLLKEASSVPFPIGFETSEDLKWFKNEKGRICVRFPGLAQHIFQIYCDRRQLHWFQRFLDDQEVKQASQDQHSSSLFTLRSAQLIWQEGKGKGEPWQVNRLALHLAVDARLWSAEGTEQVRQEKAAQTAKVLGSLRTKSSLTKTQQNYEQRLNSTLTRLNHPFQRPSKPLYQGQSHILLGVSLGLKQPATVAVIDSSRAEIPWQCGASKGLCEAISRKHSPLELRQVDGQHPKQSRPDRHRY